jgi:Asp/Glu/hydantoin racemase
MQKRIVLIDGIRIITEEIDKVFSGVIPEAELIHIVDEGIIKFEAEDQRLKRRFLKLAISAEEIGADAIVITCAHGIPSLPLIQPFVKPPVVQITMPMIEAAVNRGQTIGLISTEQTIVQPIVRMLEGAAEQANRKVAVKVGLCEEAFQARLSGNTAKYDELVIRTMEDLSKTTDLLVLAQISTERVLPKAKGSINKPILSPLIIAAEKVKTMLGQGGNR